MQSQNWAPRWLRALTGTALMAAALAMGSPLAPAQERNSQSATNAPPQMKTPVDVNSADVKTLETLPGVGPVVAQRIVKNRPYKNLDDLGKVKGLSKAKLAA